MDVREVGLEYDWQLAELKPNEVLNVLLKDMDLSVELVLVLTVVKRWL